MNNISDYLLPPRVIPPLPPEPPLISHPAIGVQESSTYDHQLLSERQIFQIPKPLIPEAIILPLPTPTCRLIFPPPSPSTTRLIEACATAYKELSKNAGQVS